MTELEELVAAAAREGGSTETKETNKPRRAASDYETYIG